MRGHWSYLITFLCYLQVTQALLFFGLGGLEVSFFLFFPFLFSLFPFPFIIIYFFLFTSRCATFGGKHFCFWRHPRRCHKIRLFAACHSKVSLLYHHFFFCLPLPSSTSLLSLSSILPSSLLSFFFIAPRKYC